MSTRLQALKQSGPIRALMASGHFEPDYFDTLDENLDFGRSAAEWLIKNGLSNAQQIARITATHFGYPLLDLSQFDFLYADIEENLLQAGRGLEVKLLYKRQNTLFVGVSDPTDQQLLQQVKFRSRMQIEPIVVEYDKLNSNLSNQNNGIDDGLLQEVALDTAALESLDNSPDIDDAPIVRFVQRTLSEALHKGASDIHFEPYEKSYRVRFRIDGVLQEASQPPLGAKAKIAARIKVMSQLNTTVTRLPQDGRLRVTLGADDRKIDFRVSILPTLFGEKIVMRLLDSTRSVLGIEQLGLEAKQRKDVEKALAKPHGMILVTGPTGSGKTVSLYTFLQMLNEESVNISTVEDPAEINIPGINQVNINDRIGLSFAKALRSLLRQDPDVIMVGEIRDLETADISIKASQTGHKVLSTLHTNDATATIIRLKNMGVESFNIASSLNLVIAQRLVRKLCRCKVPHPFGVKGLVHAGFCETAPKGDWTPLAAKGCDACNGTGHSGRTGIYEVMPISETMQELIIGNASALDMERQARSEGVLSMKDSGLIKIQQGMTSIEEILSATKAD